MGKESDMTERLHFIFTPALDTFQVAQMVKNLPAKQEGESESEVTQSCLTLCHPMDCSLPGSSVHGIFQASIPE